MTPIRVLIADDQDIVREALADVIHADSSLQLVGSAVDAREAATMAEVLRPDVALLDVRMPQGGGPQAARDIRRLSPETRVVALSAYGDSETVFTMLEDGTISYLVKGAEPAEVTSAIHAAVRGLGALSSEVTGIVIKRVALDLERETLERIDLEERSLRITAAMSSSHLTMAFQPVIELVTGASVGFEALARFDMEPRRTPDVWFAEAATVGATVALELSAIRRAVAAYSDRRHQGFLAVNASPLTILSGDLVAVARCLDGSLVVEITEHALIPDYDLLNKAVDELRGYGTRLAVDDAGAGFASLRHILKLRPDIIKLDISLTQGVDEDDSTRAMAAALVAFAAQTKAIVIAEGIETKQELNALVGLGVQFGQGYFLGRPGALP